MRELIDRGIWNRANVVALIPDERVIAIYLDDKDGQTALGWLDAHVDDPAVAELMAEMRRCAPDLEREYRAWLDDTTRRDHHP